MEGYAIENLFIPRRADRLVGVPARGDPLRKHDKNDCTLGAWHVGFINPADEETSAQLVEIIAERHKR